MWSLALLGKEAASSLWVPEGLQSSEGSSQVQGWEWGGCILLILVLTSFLPVSPGILSQSSPGPRDWQWLIAQGLSEMEREIVEAGTSLLPHPDQESFGS